MKVKLGELSGDESFEYAGYGVVQLLGKPSRDGERVNFTFSCSVGIAKAIGMDPEELVEVVIRP